MSFEEAMQNPNKGYILKQKELLHQTEVDYHLIVNDCTCDDSNMLRDAFEMCFDNIPLNIQTWLLILGTFFSGEQIKNIWSTGELLEAS